MYFLILQHFEKEIIQQHFTGKKNLQKNEQVFNKYLTK